MTHGASPSPTFIQVYGGTRSTPVRTALAAALLLLIMQTGGRAAIPEDLPYTKGFLVTGNYVVGSVDLNEEISPPDVNGFSTATISMSGVPAGADILAAYLFWETITLSADDSQANGVKFRGTEIDLTNVVAVKRASRPTNTENATCFGTGVPLMTHMFRADVLALLPMQLDKDDKPTGKRLVNSADLVAHGLPLHTVTLPLRLGNQIPESAGASLVVVYRDSTQPLRKIVIYNGNGRLTLDDPLERSLQGFYKSASTPSAKITYIVASGQPNNNDKISFNDVQIAADAFAAGSASQRAWAENASYDVSSLMNLGTTSSVYGETVKTKVYHQPGTGGEDCLNWGAVIFSTAVADLDHDGLPDGLEDASAGLKDPDGQDLPNLNAMGASSRASFPNGPLHPDIFVEFNAMWAAAGTSYGSTSAPFSSTTPTIIDAVGHHHIPTPEVLKMLGDAYAARGITPHFDVGDITSYHSLGVVPHTDWVDDYTSLEADPYLVPSHLARGGEIVRERACVPSDTVTCQFPAYPGTVRWRFGLQVNRDGPVGDDGQELTTSQELASWAAAGTHRRRFDPVRRGLFHYVLYAHSRAKPKSALPCLINGVPAPYDSNNNTACNIDNPDFHVPSSTSGIADLPGGNVLVTLGFWNEFVGRPFARAATTFHELGHNLELYHGGLPPIWGSKSLNTATYVEPNCKPNYLSSMSYLFQVHGLFDDNDEIHLDYSGTVHDAINEQATLSDAPLFPTSSYQPAWFAPAGSALALSLGVSPATRFCSGGRFDPLAPPASTARVHAASASAPIDWNGDTLSNSVPFQDGNFDNTLTGPPRQLNGFDDWASIRLDQIGAGRDVGTGFFHGGVAEGGVLEMAEGGVLELAEGGVLELAEGGVLELAEGGVLELAEGGVLELAEGGVLELAEGQEEMSYAHAKGLAIGRPYGLSACVIGRDPGCPNAPPFDPQYHRVELRFKASTVGDLITYQVQRKRAGAPDNTYATVGTSPTNRFIDPTELADGIQYEYRVRAQTAEGDSSWSRSAVITAANDTPVAAANAYATNNKTTLTVAAPGVLANDADGDSPLSFTGRRALLVGGPANGTLTLNPDGSFTYRSRNGFDGDDSFTYKADDGLSSDAPTVPLSGQSETVTVTITVTKK
jgi:Bacterial Ig domain